MEDVLGTLGWVALVLLVIVGLLAGWIASAVAGGRHRTGYLVIGVLGALAAPFLLAAVGVGVLAAGGIIAILIAALVGAVIVLLIARLVFR